jgi:hypothetical protein
MAFAKYVSSFCKFADSSAILYFSIKDFVLVFAMLLEVVTIARGQSSMITPLHLFSYVHQV